MVELVNGMDFHNFNLDCKPKECFKRNKEKETVGEWLTRVSYHPERDFLQDLKFRKEKYDPFKDKSTGISRLLNVEVYYKSYGVFIMGILCILVSIIFMFFLPD